MKDKGEYLHFDELAGTDNIPAAVSGIPSAHKRIRVRAYSVGACFTVAERRRAITCILSNHHAGGRDGITLGHNVRRYIQKHGGKRVLNI